MKINTENLLDRVLVARPDATPDDVRKLAPLLAHLPDADLAARIAKAHRRKERADNNQ
ncbi:hypothetical protein [Alteraurantiacibacter palmitatis]|uniref:DUF1778 domain-containing protein n=1 Tax=Alteraurantiacibacter palmitatis TaxID=2054628 RepID=A0ABV7E0M1_9SPHN